MKVHFGQVQGVDDEDEDMGLILGWKVMGFCGKKWRVLESVCIGVCTGGMRDILSFVNLGLPRLGDEKKLTNQGR